MKKVSAENTAINIYSKSKLIYETLAQVYERRRIKTLAPSRFSLGTPPYILVIDLTQEAMKNSEFWTRFAALCPTILLVSAKVSMMQGATVLQAPIHISDLLDAIDRQSTNIARRISKGIFLNSRTLRLIKVFGSKFEEIKLTRTEYNILQCLYRNKAATEQEMLKAVFGYSSLASTNTVKTHICRLRQKIGKALVKSTDKGYELCL